MSIAGQILQTPVNKLMLYCIGLLKRGMLKTGLWDYFVWLIYEQVDDSGTAADNCI